MTESLKIKFMKNGAVVLEIFQRIIFTTHTCLLKNQHAKFGVRACDNSRLITIRRLLTVNQTIYGMRDSVAAVPPNYKRIMYTSSLTTPSNCNRIGSAVGEL